METHVVFERDRQHVSEEVQCDPSQTLRITCDTEKGQIYIDSATREALYEFGRTLMHEALFGGDIEFYPLLVEGDEALVVNGVRLTADSSRVFVFLPAGNASNAATRNA